MFARLPLALLLLARPVAAQEAAGTLRVGPGEAYASPSAALEAAAPGDTVRVKAGTWAGPFTVDRPLVLLGEPGATLDGRGEGSVLTVTADSVEVRGLVLRGGGRSLDHDDAAVKLVRCTGCRVLENTVEEALHGVYLLESHGVTVRGNRVTGDTTLAEARRGNGIHLFHSTGNVVEDNRIRRTRDGIYFSFASDNRIEGNEVTEVRYGLHYMYSDDNRFRGNRFSRSAAGAAIMFSKRISLRDNLFAEHVGYRAYGILLQTSEGIVAERNRIEGNLVGVFMDNAQDNTFRGNVIAGNGVGVDLVPSAEGNVFHENAIVKNRTAVRKAPGGGVNLWSLDGRGNYWGEGEVFDLDGDGVGDRPYRPGDPFSSLAAARPVLEVFAGTLAARALSWAESALPVFDLPRAVDPHPLVAPPPGLPLAVPGPGGRGR